MSKNFDLQQQFSFGCGQNGCGNHGGLCPTCEKSFIASTEMKCPDGNSHCTDAKLCNLCQSIAQSVVKTRGWAFGGSACEAPDVKPLQRLRTAADKLCLDCQRGNPQQGCSVCAMMRKTHEVEPFTKQAVEQLYKNLKEQFKPSLTGRTFQLKIALDSQTIGSIDWTMHNCAHSAFVLMLASSNAGMNSINQKIFAGYMLAVIIKSLQETGKCDPILLEVFRLELSNLFRNLAWSNWSELTDFGNLYNECVKLNIILGDNVVIVPQKMHVAPFLNGKTVSLCVEAQQWVPSINHLKYGIFSSDTNSRFCLKGAVLFPNNHFSVIQIIGEQIWLIDGMGKRTGEFTAESTKTRLKNVSDFQQMCSDYGAFFFFEEIPSFFEAKFDSSLFPPQQATSAQIVPALPPPPAPCASGPWSPPPAFPPPPPPCVQIVPALPPSQLAPSAQVAWVLPSPPQLGQIIENHIVVSGRTWSCEGKKYSGIVEKSPHPQFPSFLMEVYLFETQRYTEIKLLVEFLNFCESVNGS